MIFKYILFARITDYMETHPCVGSDPVAKLVKLVRVLISISPEIRMRTVRAVTDIELIYLTRDSVQHLCTQYPELRARMTRFEVSGMLPEALMLFQVCFLSCAAASGRMLTKKRLRALDMTLDELKEMSAGYKEKQLAARAVREQDNLGDEVFISSDKMPQTHVQVIGAAARFKKMGVAARAKEAEETMQKRESMEKDMQRQGGVGAVLKLAQENQTQMNRMQIDIALQVTACHVTVSPRSLFPLVTPTPSF